MCLCKQSSMGMGMCVPSSNTSPVHSHLCVCNGSTPESYIKGAPRDVCLCTHKIKGRHGWVFLSSSLSHRQLLVCVMYMYANTAEWLQLHKAVILLLVIKYFVLKIVSYSHTTTPYNLLSSPHKESPSQDTPTNCI